MDKISLEQALEELVLLILYLTCWEEKEFDVKWYRSWKGYPFNILDKLAEKEYISGSKKAKSVYMKEKGIEKAKELKEKYFSEMSR
jgi:hypothetical protein